ncbi:hypothetical protein R0381_001004 [Jeongeupia wiesaeckerbachi]|uniref:hypothetical protein n=1 Tax=Jeongeupia wiesaeckerbachi TaxID=3051218 RepID=UPI003D808545
MDLYQQLQDVTDANSFLAFANALLADRLADPAQWQHQTIEDFLGAALNWAESTQLGKIQGLAEVSPWKRCAVFLYSGKVCD